ncbi:MAG: hypothetical protein ACTSVV_07470 [Promethearchaeota archaeon]
MTKIKLCPKCREPSLKSALNVSGWLAPDLFECTKCGYVGQLYIEIDTEEFVKNDENEK